MKHRPNRRRSRGLTLIEVLVAVLIGSLVLAAATAFFLQGSKFLSSGINQDQATSQGQLAMANLVKEIKTVNIDSPPLFASTPAWNTLPALPYSAYELSSYPNTSSTVVVPTMPAARKFASQVGATDMYHKWYPNPSGNESNSLVFYKAPAPAPGGNSAIERITFRLVGRQLIREVQSPLTATSVQFHSNPVPLRRMLADDVQSVQFSYPQFEAAMTTALDTDLTALSEPDLSRFINENYRKVIRIRLVMGGLRLGNQDTPSVELKTEVRLRSE